MPATSRVAWSSPFRAATLTTSSLSTCPSPPGNLIVIFRSVPFSSSSHSQGAELVLPSFLCIHTFRHRNHLSCHGLQGIHHPNGGVKFLRKKTMEFKRNCCRDVFSKWFAYVLKWGLCVYGSSDILIVWDFGGEILPLWCVCGGGGGGGGSDAVMACVVDVS